MMIPIRLHPINPAHLTLVKASQPFSAPGPDVEDNAVRLRDERLHAGGAVFADLGSDYGPEAREPGVFEERRGEENPELEGGEEREDGAREIGEGDEHEVEWVD